jgi:hypothetical protein
MLGSLGGARLWTSLGGSNSDLPSQNDDDSSAAREFRGLSIVDPLRRNVPARPARAPDLKAALASDLKASPSPPWSGVTEYRSVDNREPGLGGTGGHASPSPSPSKKEAYSERGRAIEALERLHKHQPQDHYLLPLHRQLDEVEDAPSEAHANTPPGTLRGKAKARSLKQEQDHEPDQGRTGGGGVQGNEHDARSSQIETAQESDVPPDEPDDLDVTQLPGVAAAMAEGEKLTEQRMMACLTLCHALKDQLQKDVLSVETATSATGFSTKSTVGIMLNGRLVSARVT